MLVVPLVFVLLAGVGLGAFFGVGTPVNGSPLVNVIMILSGAAAATLGIWLVRRPSGFSVSDNAGIDAFGVQRYGAARAGTREEIVRTGLIFAAIGVAIVVLGVFMGALTG